MKFFTKQSSKAVAKRFVLLFLTMLAFGFTANAQIPTFNEILERYYNPQNLVVKAITAQTPPYGQQFENYTFEEWEDQETGGIFSKDFSEPYNWNSFMTADASFGLKGFLSNQLEASSEKRPGSNGSKSARIFSKSTAGIVANGNMTNGRIRAGSTTAADNANYNYTSRSNANYNTSLTTIPDSLTVWVAFKPKNASKGNAKITTTIHGDTDFKQLASSGNSPVEMVCATADAEIAATTSSTSSAVVWKRMSIPFTKGSHNDPRYILATFNTNVTPGEGSNGDELYVDDICLIYNPTLNVGSIAQTEYNITNDLTANIEVPFTLTGSMSVYNLNEATNEVIAQLSDANGSFENPIELGRVTTDVSGTINGVIPAGLLTGKGYRVRVVSTNYPMTSDDNGTNLVINCLSPQVTISKGDVLQKSATIKFTPTEYCAQYYIMAVPASETVDAAYVKENGEVQTGTFTKTFENLVSRTDYAIYALPVGGEGELGKLTKILVKTQAFVPQINDIAKGLVTAKSITVTFTPTNTDCAEYYFMIAPATETVDAATIKANNEKQKVAFEKTFENLTSNTAYKIYALPVDVDGFNGEIKSVTITTPALVPQTTIATKVSTKSATVTFTPNPDCSEYYFMIAPATEIVNAEVVKSNGEKQTAAHEVTFESLISNTDYVIYVLSIDAEGNGPLSTTAIKTQAFVPQINDIEKGLVTAKSITVTFTPNSDCFEYYFMIAPATETVDAATIKANNEKQTETFEKTFEDLTSNTAYTIYVLPVDIDGFNGEIKSVTITTNALVPTVTVTPDEILTKSATVTFTPNADCVEYYFLIAPATDTVNAEVVKLNGEKQTAAHEETFESLISNTDYVIYVLSIDVEGNGPLSTTAIKTQAFVPQVDVERGNVAAKSITVTFTPTNTDCAEYYFMIAPATETVDAAMIKANNEKQTAVSTKTFENLTSNTAYKIYALPVDIDGFNGEIKSVIITTNALVPEVEITKDEALTYSMTTSFAPNTDCVEYYFMIAESTETVNAEVVKSNGEKQTEAYTATWEKLLPSTNYTIYALPIDEEGKEGNLNTLTVKTRAEAGESEIDIEIEKLSYTSVTITAKPNENTILYHYIVIEKEEADAMGEDALKQKLIENENYLDSVADVYTMTVESNVAYYVVAQGKNRDDKWGVVTTEEFTVSGPAAVETTVEKLNETTVKVTATPNKNTVSYQYIVIKKEEADAMDEAALIQKLEATNSLNGVDEWTYTVESKVEYYVIARGKNADGMIGEMTQVEFTVAGPATVAIAVEKLNETTVSVAATPNENAVSYSYIIIAKAEADAMTSEEIVERLTASENKFAAANTKEFTVESNVAYYVMAQAVNADDMNGVITQVEFTVSGPAAVETTVEKLNETTVKVTATPNKNTVSYQYIVIKKEEADAMDEAALIQKLEAANSHTGVDEWTYTVESNVEYYVIARGKNADGMIGEMTQVEFTVAGPATVAIAVEKLNETTVTVAATPNENAVEYSYIIIAKAEAETMTSEEIAERLNASENVFEAANTKEFTVESNVAYYVMAQAVNADDMNGVITQVEFTVAGPAAVSIVVEEVSKSSVKVTATPNENTVSYQYIVIEKAEADTLSADAISQRLEAANDLNGVDEWTYTIKSNVEYYVIAQGKNADGMIGEMTKFEFMVEEAGPAIVEIEVKEVSDTLVSITATPNENTVEYHYIIIEKAEADTIGEDALMERLNNNEDFLEGITTKEFSVESNVEYYVVAQAVNADGVFGKVTMVEFFVEGGSSVSELNYIFEVYPNPASEYVRITSNNEIETLVVFSIDGKVVYAETVNQEETMIDVTSFAKGSYIVRMISNDKIFVRRIVVK